MHDDPHCYGPHFEPGLIGARGELLRLHKGAKPQPAPTTPPPVRETARDVQQAKELEMANASGKSSLRRTLLGGQAVPEDQTGRKTLLGQ